MRGLFTLTFEIDGDDPEAIEAQGLELKRLFIKAAPGRVPKFRPGTFQHKIEGTRPAPEPAPEKGDPERLFET